MPIKNFTDNPPLPRIDKVHLGYTTTGKRQDGSEYTRPNATDYFVFPEWVHKILGPKPNTLEIMFPSNEIDQVADANYKAYSKSRGSRPVCKGDGEHAVRLVDKAAPKADANGVRLDPPIVHHSVKDVERRTVDCPGQECEYYQRKLCRQIMNLMFILPGVPGAGVWQLDTSSYYGMSAVLGTLQLVQNATKGRIAMIPFRLSLIPMEVAPEDRVKTVWVLKLEAKHSIPELISMGDETPALLAGKVEPGEEIPDLLFGEEEPDHHEAAIVDGAARVAEAEAEPYDGAYDEEPPDGYQEGDDVARKEREEWLAESGATLDEANEAAQAFFDDLDLTIYDLTDDQWSEFLQMAAEAEAANSEGNAKDPPEEVDVPGEQAPDEDPDRATFEGITEPVNAPPPAEQPAQPQRRRQTASQGRQRQQQPASAPAAPPAAPPPPQQPAQGQRKGKALTFTDWQVQMAGQFIEVLKGEAPEAITQSRYGSMITGGLTLSVGDVAQILGDANGPKKVVEWMKEQGATYRDAASYICQHIVDSAK